jgi:hypothetical protein
MHRIFFIIIGGISLTLSVGCKCQDNFNNKDGEITTEVLDRFARRDVVYTDTATWGLQSVDDITCNDLCRYTFYPGYIESIEFKECTTDFDFASYSEAVDTAEPILGTVSCKGKVEYLCN